MSVLVLIHSGHGSLRSLEESDWTSLPKDLLKNSLTFFSSSLEDIHNQSNIMWHFETFKSKNFYLVNNKRKIS